MPSTFEDAFERVKQLTADFKDFYGNKCAAQDRQIDARVYELYSLTDDEIKMVEVTAQ